MSVIEAVKVFVATFTGLETGAPLSINSLEADGPSYSIVPLPGARIVETYMDESTLEEFPFAFQMTGLTDDEVERIKNSAFFEDFAKWLKSQTNSGVLPDLENEDTPTGMTAEEIEATGWGFLYQQGESQTGVYQIQCKLTYQQAA